MKRLYFDLETTGVKFWKNGIHQISGIIDIDGQEKESFNFHVKPYHAAIIEREALAVSGIEMSALATYEDMGAVYRKIIAILSKYVQKFNKKDKFVLCGYNSASFDNPFFRAFFTQCGDKYFGSWFWQVPRDIMVLAFDKLEGEIHKMPNFKLMTVAEHLGIQVDESLAHDALYDVRITRLVDLALK